MHKATLQVIRPQYPGIFGGMGFNNLETGLYPLMNPEFFNQYVAKCHMELSPGFSRCWGGFAEWTKEAMDAYYECYSRMQAKTDTIMYLVPGRAVSQETPEARRQWASDVADRLAYLYHEKGMKHIRYFCMSNEQSLDRWGALIDNMELMKEYHTYLFREFQKRRLPIGLMAPDVSEPRNYHTLFWSMSHMAEISAAYTSHLYLHGTFDAEDTGMYKWAERMFAGCAASAKGQEKFFLLSEYGWGQFQGNPPTADGDTADYPSPALPGTTLDYPRYTGTPKEAYSLLSIAELNLACINAGVFATGYWSFVDYPDPQICAYRTGDEWGRKWNDAYPYLGWGIDIRYNKCGVLRFNDFEHPAADSYWCVGLMTRYMKQDTQVMHLRGNDPLLRAAALRDRKGHISLCIVNRHAEETELSLSLGALAQKPLRQYVYDPQNVPRNAFADLQPYSALIAVDAEGHATTRLGGNTVVILTTDYEERTPAQAENVRLEGGRLTWDAVSEAEHRYYRVFADGRQIASTVETSLPAPENAREFQVYSVDQYGNCAGKER